MQGSTARVSVMALLLPRHQLQQLMRPDATRVVVWTCRRTSSRQAEAEAGSVTAARRAVSPPDAGLGGTRRP